MCGICGEFRADGGIVPETIVAMRDSLVHRGPDSPGLFVSSDRRVGLGFRRLRIVDLSPAADQPMSNEDGSVQIVFNGEIYNFQELRRGLVARGHTFRSHSDTEVIVHHYEEKGPEGIADLDGMFALAIWDARRRRLTLARDRAGKKPLFYYRKAGRLAFASEMKAFFQHPDIPIDPDVSTFPSYFLHGYVPCPDTLYRDVKQVEPGSLLIVDHDGSCRAQTYWRFQYPTIEEAAAKPAPSRREAVAEVRRLVEQAVERRLISDVPIGAFLSGGIDSSIVVGVMARLMREPVKTFSIGFEGDPAYDETSYARIVAKRFGTDHTEFRVAPSAIDLVEKLVWHHDGAFGDSSAVPTYIVSELTRRHVTVVLTGDGGDELFAGYNRFIAGVYSERIPRPLRRLMPLIFSGLGSPSSDRHLLARAKRFAKAASLPLDERMTRWASVFYEDLEALFNPESLARLSPIDRLRYLERDRPLLEGRSTLSRILHPNFRSYLLDDLLVKADRCTMAASLEGRSPFLDRELIEYAAALPDRMKLSGRTTKVVLREAFADLLPQEVKQRGKMGFGVPLGTWFRGELRDYVRDVLLSRDARYPMYLSRPKVEQLVRDHQEGRANLGLQLWTLLTFEVWLRLLPEWTHCRSRMTAVPSLSSATDDRG